MTVSVRLTLKELRAAGACAAGIDAFRRSGLVGRNVTWTPLCDIWLAVSSLRHYAAWARANGLLPPIRLVGADLSSAYLSGADLRNADLSGADLSGADLSSAYLSGAYLSGADLSGADLSSAYLSGAYLRNADLRDADLRNADLRGADLRNAYLSGAYRSDDEPPIPGWTSIHGRLVRTP